MFAKISNLTKGKFSCKFLQSHFLSSKNFSSGHGHGHEVEEEYHDRKFNRVSYNKKLSESEREK
jgi:hypothetical protein